MMTSSQVVYSTIEQICRYLNNEQACSIRNVKETVGRRQHFYELSNTTQSHLIENYSQCQLTTLEIFNRYKVTMINY